MARQTIVRLLCDRCAQQNRTADGEEHRISIDMLRATLVLCDRCASRYLGPLTALIETVQSGGAPTGGRVAHARTLPARRPLWSVEAGRGRGAPPRAGHSLIECRTCDPPVGLVSDKRYDHTARVHPGKRVWDLAWVPLPGSCLLPCPGPACHGYPVAGVAGMAAHARFVHRGDEQVIEAFRAGLAKRSDPLPSTQETS